MSSKFLITTAIDYTNDVIHVGHAYQKIVADVLARFYRAAGKQVYFLTGTDEYGETSLLAAQKADQEPSAYVDEISAADKKQLDSLNISYDRFIRTTDLDHAATVKEFWQRVYDAGDIYFGKYQGWYCVGCESFKTVRELKDGECLLHPTRELEKVTEKNYFFRWKKYASFLRQWLSNHPNFVLPPARRAEMLAFLKQGLEDIPISRATLKWGIPVPNDASQVIYVWFDALINYYTGAKSAGFWDKETKIIHLVGKDNTRWHTLLWPAMLQSAGLRLPDTVFNHSFLTLEGQKISKTLGNIIRPAELTAKYGVDAVRYYLLKYGPLLNDADISLKKMEGAYNADLANGLGNTVARIAKLCEPFDLDQLVEKRENRLLADIEQYFDPNSHGFLRVDSALEVIWGALKGLDAYLDRERPWQREADERKQVIAKIVIGGEALSSIREIAEALTPFLPDTANKIKEQFALPRVKVSQPLFPRH